jgi:hypothetical protein
VWLNDKGEEMLAAAVTNEGDAPIRGYLLTTRFFDPATGAFIRRFTTKQLETHGNPVDYLAPGSTWVADPHRFSYLADGTLVSYEIMLKSVSYTAGISLVAETRKCEVNAVALLKPYASYVLWV